MEWIGWAVEFVLHLDRHLNQLAGELGLWLYAVLFVIIFCETGLVVTPFLPGDSLIFACGALAAGADSPLSIWGLFVVMATAGIAGDTVNYHIGKFVGPKIFHAESGRFFRREYLDRTHRFYERHGGKTIILARFIPIIRTFAPFVAGIGAMTYFRFLFYNVIGALAWVGLFLAGGYWFGNLPIVRRNFTLVIAAIIVISVMPMVIEWWRSRRGAAAG